MDKLTIVHSYNETLLSNKKEQTTDSTAGQISFLIDTNLKWTNKDLFLILTSKIVNTNRLNSQSFPGFSIILNV